MRNVNRIPMMEVGYVAIGIVNAMKNKTYQINSSAIILADGFIKAKNKKEATKKWKKFIHDEMKGLSFAECKVTDIFTEKDENYDHGNSLEDKDFDSRFDAWTASYLN